VTVIELTTALATTPERAFDLSIDVDAHAASMTGSGERIAGGVRSGRLTLATP
jgi:hypothetical protein